MRDITSDSDFAAGLREFRRSLHAEPEIGLDLPRTQEKVVLALEDSVTAPLRIDLGRSCTSVTAVLDGDRSGPTVLLRADMDGLPITEQVDVPYRSATSGVMHACGHDLHTAMLLGAAQLLARERDQLQGSVVFMFQPGEEGFDGCGRMIDDGILNVTGHRPIAAYALHVMSSVYPHASFASRPGPLMAAMDASYVTVRGAGGHGSAPHLARDPIPAACNMVTALQTIVSRQLDPCHSAVLTVGQFHAGTKRTIIPETADFEISIRTVDPVIRAEILTAVTRVCEGVAAAHGVTVEVLSRPEFELTINDVDETAFAADTVAELFGADRGLELEHPVMGSEDFSRVLSAVPGAMVFLGACPTDLDHRRAPYNHAPLARFDDGVLADGARLYAELALRRLAML